MEEGRQRLSGPQQQQKKKEEQQEMEQKQARGWDRDQRPGHQVDETGELVHSREKLKFRQKKAEKMHWQVVCCWV